MAIRSAWWAALASLLILAGTAGAGEIKLSDDISIDVYGFVLANAQYTSGATRGADLPVFALPEDDDEAFDIFANQTRFGFKIHGPDVGSANLDGRIELDLWGLRGSVPPGGYNQAAPRTRLAYLTLGWEDTTITVGQDWVRTFAPLNPTTLAKVSVTEFSSSGNLWNRLPQIRLDQNLPLTEDTHATVDVALIKPFGADVNPTPPAQGSVLGGGEQSGLPFAEARLALSMPLGEESFTVGVAGHYGREDYAVEDLTTFGLAVDLDLPFCEWFGLKGEYYTGQNLAMLFSNGFQLGDPNTEATADEQDVEGGWVQLSLKCCDPGSVNVGYGYEDPDDADIAANGIDKNQTFFANYIHSFNDRFKMAFEVIRLDTSYAGADDEDAMVYNLAWQLLF